MTTSPDLIPQRYIRLALGIEQHIPGYVDAYFGPPEWRDQAEKRSVTELVSEASDLAKALARDTEMYPQRRVFLARQMRAIQTSLRILQGAQLTLTEETEALYDITPEWIAEDIFKEAHRALDELLPTGGTLIERMAMRKKVTEITFEQVEPLLGEIIAELRRRAKATFPLPSNETFELQVVTSQPWRAYNWYLGDYRSRIDINTDLPLHVTDLADLMAHEGYPGHHTELSIKEAQLVREKGWVEHSIALINAPSCVVAEGIATRALSILMTDEEKVAWSAELFRRAGFDNLDSAREHEIDVAHQKLRGVRGNAAFLVHDQDASEDEAVAYLQEHALLTLEEASKALDFTNNPLFRSYIFTYRYGGEMLDALFASQDDKKHWFTRLLTEPVTPGQIRAWAEG
jgi:hypothetical protein